MKSLLKFNLNNPDERMEFERATKATDLAIILWELIYNVPRQIEDEIESDKLIERYEVLEAYRKKINELCEEHNIQIDKLII
jgi:hypothetical protein